MVNLGVEGESIRRCIFRMCSLCALEEEPTKTVMQLVSNMTRANEMLDGNGEVIIL